MRKLISKYLNEGFSGRGVRLLESRSFAMFTRRLDTIDIPRPMIAYKDASSEIVDLFRLLDLLVRAVLPLAMKANDISASWFKAQEPIVYDANRSATISQLNRILTRLDDLASTLGDYDESAELDSLQSVLDFIYEAIEDGIIPAIRLLGDNDDAPVRRMIQDATNSLSNAFNSAIYAGANEAKAKRYLVAVLDGEPLFGDETI